MPIYRWRCRDCGGEFELRSHVEDRTAGCLRCGGTSDRMFTTQVNIRGLDPEFIDMGRSDVIAEYPRRAWSGWRKE